MWAIFWKTDTKKQNNREGFISIRYNASVHKGEKDSGHEKCIK